MSTPAKYRKMGDFHEYYSGKAIAPYLTIFIGGNHEASNHSFELYYGGWAAPNIYYMGAANVLRVGPLRVLGMSGIWDRETFNNAHFERGWFSHKEVRRAFTLREWDVRKLLQVRTQVDVGLSHDWPNKIEHEGDMEALLREQPNFKSSIDTGRLGSPPTRGVLDTLRPSNWFSGHMHVKFTARVEHSAESSRNGGIVNDATDFLALDKAEGPRIRNALELVEVKPPTSDPIQRPLSFEYDPEWLAITRAFSKLLPNGDPSGKPSGSLPIAKDASEYQSLIDTEKLWIEENVVKKGGLKIPSNFAMTAPEYNEELGIDVKGQNVIHSHPSTEAYCDMLQIPNPFKPTDSEVSFWGKKVVIDGPYVGSKAFNKLVNGQGPSSRGGVPAS